MLVSKGTAGKILILNKVKKLTIHVLFIAFCIFLLGFSFLLLFAATISHLYPRRPKQKETI